MDPVNCPQNWNDCPVWKEVKEEQQRREKQTETLNEIKTTVAVLKSRLLDNGFIDSIKKANEDHELRLKNLENSVMRSQGRNELLKPLLFQVLPTALGSGSLVAILTKILGG